MAGEPEFESDESRFHTRQIDQDRTLLAMQQLEAALASPAPGREGSWRESVSQTLAVLGKAARLETENANRPDGLLSDLARNQPRLRNRVRGLRLQYRQLQDVIEQLRTELDQARDSDFDFADYRHRLAWVLSGLRHQSAKESDLIYEAYYEAFRTDLPRDVDREFKQ